MTFRGKFERAAYFLCMWTVNRKAGGPRRGLHERKSGEGGVLPVQFGALFPALLMGSMK